MHISQTTSKQAANIATVNSNSMLRKGNTQCLSFGILKNICFSLRVLWSAAATTDIGSTTRASSPPEPLAIASVEIIAILAALKATNVQKRSLYNKNRERKYSKLPFIIDGFGTIFETGDFLGHFWGGAWGAVLPLEEDEPEPNKSSARDGAGAASLPLVGVEDNLFWQP
jgi:hypothetical protein